MKGFSTVEIVIGAALVAVIVTGIASAWQFYLKLNGQSARASQAALLIEEGAEALQYIRDKSWAGNIGSLSLSETYYVIWNGSDYIITSMPLVSNGYVRKVTFAAVNRDSSDNIAASGTLDPGTLKATISIYPDLTGTTAILQGEMLLHNIYAN